MPPPPPPPPPPTRLCVFQDRGSWTVLPAGHQAILWNGFQLRKRIQTQAGEGRTSLQQKEPEHVCTQGLISSDRLGQITLSWTLLTDEATSQVWILIIGTRETSQHF